MDQENNRIISQATFRVSNLQRQEDLILDNLQKIEGVTNIQGDFQRSTVTLDFDPTRIDPSQISNLLSQAGIAWDRID